LSAGAVGGQDALCQSQKSHLQAKRGGSAGGLLPRQDSKFAGRDEGKAERKAGEIGKKIAIKALRSIYKIVFLL